MDLVIPPGINLDAERRMFPAQQHGTQLGCLVNKQNLPSGSCRGERQSWIGIKDGMKVHKLPLSNDYVLHSAVHSFTNKTMSTDTPSNAKKFSIKHKSVFSIINLHFALPQLTLLFLQSTYHLHTAVTSRLRHNTSPTHQWRLIGPLQQPASQQQHFTTTKPKPLNNLC
jgi:hypothetical protein